MKHLARALAGLGLAFGAFACSEPAAPDSTLDAINGRADPALRTDLTAYTAVHLAGEPPISQYGFQLIASFENRTPRTLYLARCNHYGLVGIVYSVARDGAGTSAYNPPWACPGGELEIAVGAGETRTDTLDIYGPRSYDRTGVPFGLLEGRMRLHYRAQACPNAAECPSEWFESNPFTVELAP